MGVDVGVSVGAGAGVSVGAGTGVSVEAGAGVSIGISAGIASVEDAAGMSGWAGRAGAMSTPYSSHRKLSATASRRA